MEEILRTLDFLLRDMHSALYEEGNNLNAHRLEDHIMNLALVAISGGDYDQATCMKIAKKALECKRYKYRKNY